MPLYQVTWGEKVWYTETIEAKDREEALEKAYQMENPRIVDSEVLGWDEVEEVMK